MKRPIFESSYSHSIGSSSLLAAVLLLMLALFSRSALAQDAQRGESLYRKLNCAKCHSVSGEGGWLGPALDGVMDRRNSGYVWLRLNKDDQDRFTQLLGHPELIAHPRYSKEKVSALISYLSTLYDNTPLEGQLHHLDSTAVGKPALSKLPASALAEGKVLFYKSGCMSCHSVAGLGGSLGPSLDGVVMRRNRESVDQFIAAPRSRGKIKMPRFNLTPSQRQKITEFLLSLPPPKRPYKPG